MYLLCICKSLHSLIFTFGATPKKPTYWLCIYCVFVRVCTATNQLAEHVFYLFVGVLYSQIFTSGATPTNQLTEHVFYCLY